MNLTKHAAKRSQQRGIPELVIDLLLRFGRRDHDHRGAEIVYFDKASRKHVERYCGSLIGKVNEHLDCYAVVADEVIVTVGVRYERVRH
ncbi:MAG: hypothetical protein R3E94_03265 [Burkholderiaceae bacterium]